MPNSDQVLLFIDQVLHDPAWIGGAIIGALAFILFIVYLIREFFDNVRQRFWR